MADPLSLAASIGTAATACLKISAWLIELGTKYAHAKAALCSLAAECSTTKVVLERLAGLMKSRPNLLSPQPGRSSQEDLGPCFENIVGAIRAGVEDLEKQISKVRSAAHSTAYGGTDLEQ
jgi:hypothetical protein